MRTKAGTVRIYNFPFKEHAQRIIRVCIELSVGRRAVNTVC